MSDSDMPEQIAGFRLLKTLGKGGMGAVYKAIHPRTGAEVALKVILQNLQAREEVQERFRREVRAMAMVEHPNMVRILEAGQDDGCSYYVMQLVDGIDMATYIKKKGALSAGLVHGVAKGLFSALTALHDQGILHRDLKPHNVMIDRGGRPQIMDLGLTRMDDMATMTKTGALIGSPRYLPPESLEGKILDPRADIYQVGLILWECATGETAVPGETFQEVSARILTGDIRDVLDHRPDFPEALASLIHRCIEPELAYRMPSSKAALDILEGRTDLEATVADLHLAEPPPAKASDMRAAPTFPLGAGPGMPGSATPPGRRGLLNVVLTRILPGLMFFGCLLLGYNLNRPPPVHPPENVEILPGVSRITVLWSGTQETPVQMVATDDQGTSYRAPEGGAQVVPPLPDGRSRLVLEGLRAGIEYEVFLRYGEQRSLARPVQVPEGLYRTGSPRLGEAPAGGPALIAQLHLPATLKVGYPKTGAGVAWTEALTAMEHTLPLPDTDLTRPGTKLHIEATDPTGEVVTERIPMENLLGQAVDALVLAAESAGKAELVTQVRADNKARGEIRSLLKGAGLERAVRDFRPLSRAVFARLTETTRTRALGAIEALREIDHIAQTSKVRMNPSPDTLLTGAYGPDDTGIEWSETVGQQRQNDLIYRGIPFQGDSSTREYRFEIPRLPRPAPERVRLSFKVSGRKVHSATHLLVALPKGAVLKIFLRTGRESRTVDRVFSRTFDARDIRARGGTVKVSLENAVRPPFDSVRIRNHRVAFSR